MTTTFPSRELVRDELAALFVADGTWKEVLGYAPPASLIAKGVSPILVIRSKGTLQEMSNMFTNPRSYRFSIQSWVLAQSDVTGDSWNSNEAEDLLDTLDQKVTQIIRTNAAGNLTNANQLRFASEYSEVIDLSPVVPYIVETRFIYADLFAGSV